MLFVLYGLLFVVVCFLCCLSLVVVCLAVASLFVMCRELLGVVRCWPIVVSRMLFMVRCVSVFSLLSFVPSLLFSSFSLFVVWCLLLVVYSFLSRVFCLMFLVW